MADDIIDLSGILEQRGGGASRATGMALWGADGERSRFALPLWRVVHLAGAERGVIFWRSRSGDRTPHPFIVLDLLKQPARLDIPEATSVCEDDASPKLHELGSGGLVVCLGTKDDRIWGLFAIGGGGREPLPSRKREDILFLSGECAGLLFLRDFADRADE